MVTRIFKQITEMNNTTLIKLQSLFYEVEDVKEFEDVPKKGTKKTKAKAQEDSGLLMFSRDFFKRFSLPLAIIAFAFAISGNLSAEGIIAASLFVFFNILTSFIEIIRLNQKPTLNNFIHGMEIQSSNKNRRNNTKRPNIGKPNFYSSRPNRALPKSRKLPMRRADKS
jgi:hypothetical protein